MVTVTITGSGTPLLVPGRAGPGVHVRSGTSGLQFDAGRATSLRLVEAGEHPVTLTALFVTHHHSDHLVGLPALLIDRWLEAPPDGPAPPLPVVVPHGPAADLAEHMMDVWDAEAALRADHTGRQGRPVPDVQRFTASHEPQVVFTADAAVVSAIAVRHEPVVPAVAYRVDTPDGSVVISGDTAVCPEVEALAAGATVLVHEAFRIGPADDLLSDPAAIAAYHSDTVAVGGLAARAGVGRVVLTHLIPPPADAGAAAAFVGDLRRGGYSGDVVVADDLSAVTF